MCKPIKRSGWIETCPPHLSVKHCIAGAAGCGWQAQIRDRGALCLSVIEAGYTTVWKQGDMTYIFLLSVPQTQTRLLPLPHTKFTCPHFLPATVPCTWEMVCQSEVQYWQKVLNFNSINGFLSCTGYQWFF